MSPAKRTLSAMMTDKKRKMPPPALKEGCLKIVRRSMNTRPAVRKGINMRWEASSLDRDKWTRAISGRPKRSEEATIQTPNSNHRLAMLVRSLSNIGYLRTIDARTEEPEQTIVGGPATP